MPRSMPRRFLRRRGSSHGNTGNPRREGSSHGNTGNPRREGSSHGNTGKQVILEGRFLFLLKPR